MKTIIATLLLTVAAATTNAQSKIKTDSTHKSYRPEKFATDSAKRGNEIYEGGKNEKRQEQPKRREKMPATKPTSTTPQ